MSQPDKAQLDTGERKIRKNRKFVSYISKVIGDSTEKRLHGKLVITFYDGEIRQVLTEKKVQNPDLESDSGES